MAAIAGAILTAAAVLALVIGTQANRALAERTLTDLDAQLRTLQAVAVREGPESLARRIAELEASAPLHRFGLIALDGQRLAGSLPPLQLGDGGVMRVPDTKGGTRLFAARAVQLASPPRTLIVARDIEDQRTLGRRIQAAALLGSAILASGIAGIGLLVRRRLLARIDTIASTARAIMNGQLEQRIPLSGDQGELDRLAVQLNTMLDRIDGLVTALGDVSDNIAHDLKTPLSRLRLTAEATLREAERPDVARDGLARILDEADGLIGTFNAMLQIARLERGVTDAQVTRLDAALLIEETAELYAPVAEDAGMRLDVQADPGTYVSGNRQLLAQALANLIDNALKYGAPAEGVAAITLSVVSAGRQIEVSVADRGAGIAAEDRARVLGRFVRLEASRSKPGTGLGLSVVAAIVRLHHGTLRLEDAKPGLRVVLVLPRADGDAGAADGTHGSHARAPRDGAHGPG